MNRKYKKAIRKYKKTTKAQRRCGNCLKTGHNRATCKNEQASKEKFFAFKNYQKKKYQEDPNYAACRRKASKGFYDRN